MSKTEREIKHPDVYVKLVGEDGNAFAIMGRVTSALKDAGVSQQECKRYTDEATSGDYNNLLRVTMSWVNTVGDDNDDPMDDLGEDDYEDED